MIRLTALILTVLTGFSGLVYEVTWERYLATLLGSHSEATAAVLGLFLGGLALGYSLFGRVTRRLVARTRASERGPRLVLTYGILEAGIGVYALVFPYFFIALQALSYAIPHGSGGLGLAFDVVLSGLLIGPPAVLMGGTIPMLTQALSHDLEDTTRFHALVYAFNTAGAFAGALAAGFWLVPALGLVGVLVAMAAINLSAGALFVAIGYAAPASLRELGGTEPLGPATSAPVSSEGRARVAGLPVFASIALLTGFAMMTVQTSLIRLGGLSFGASQFTFSMVVAVFVLCIALGSFAVSALSRIPKGVLAANLWALFLGLCLLYPQLQDGPYWAHVLRSLFRDQPAGFYPYYLSAFGGVLAVIGLPVMLSGAALPLIFHQLRNDVAGLGDVAGRLYSWNTVGSMLGALLGGYALLYWLDLHHVFRIALAALALAALLATLAQVDFRRQPLPARLGAGLMAASAFALPVLLPPWLPERLSSGIFRTRAAEALTFAGPEAWWAGRRLPEVRFYDDDPTTSVAVLEYSQDPLDRTIVTNGKSDGSAVHDYLTMALAALLPALLAERAERAFVIGYGTGVTVGEFAALRSAREVVVAEISPGVIEAAPLFDYANLGAPTHPTVRIVQSDAFRALMRSDTSFDVIVSEPSNPWVTGVEMLFSREFLEAARDHLEPGGVYAQWFHAYETDAETIGIVFRTYEEVFDHVAVWYAAADDLLLLGFRSPGAALDLERLAARAERPDFRAGLSRCKIDGLLELLAHELLPLDVIQRAYIPGEVHTLLHPRLSHAAARAFFTGASGTLPATVALDPARVGHRNSLLRRYFETRGGRISEREWTRLVVETCHYLPSACLTLLAEWTHAVPRSEARKKVKKQIRAHPLLNRAIDLDRVGPLSQLYGDAPPRPLRDGADPVAEARRATDLFVKYYHHGAPFSRHALARLWERCERDPGLRERCAQGRSRAERLLGDLEVEVGPGNAAASADPPPIVVPLSVLVPGSMSESEVSRDSFFQDRVV